MANTSQYPLSFRVITSAEALRTLRPEWDALWLRAEAPVFQSLDYTLLAWETVRPSPAARLCCLVGHAGGRLVAVWPLVVERRKLLWRAMRPMALISTESSGILVEPGDDAARHVAAAWDALRRLAKADLLWLSYLDDGSPLQAAITAQPGRATILQEQKDTSWIVSWPDNQGWDEWYAGLNASYRRAQKKKYAILARLGETRFEILNEVPACMAAVDTLLNWKRDWARQFKDQPGGWLFDPRYGAFLRRYFTTPGTSAQPRVCTLTLAGAPVAILLATVGPKRIDALIAGFDPRHAQASPGMALYEHCLRWAHASGRSIDFGPGQELNKRAWCHDRPQPVTSYGIALTRWGVMATRSQHLARQLAGRLRRKRRNVSGDAPAS